MLQQVKNLPAMQETEVRSLGWEDSPREGNGNPPQYSCLKNSMDRGAWQDRVHGVDSAIKTNKFQSVVVRRMNLEPLIQSEVSQKEKNKDCILTHIYAI